MDNLNKTPDFFLVNLRAGLQNEDWAVEMFIDNLLDDDTLVAVNRFTDFNRGFDFSQRGVRVTPASKRQFGVRFLANF